MIELGYKISEMTAEKIIEIKGNPRKFDLFIMRNKGFLNSVTVQFAKKREDHYEDLYQVACMGLFKAIDKFDENRRDASKLSTFAWKCITNDLIQETKRQNKIKFKESSMENWKREFGAGEEPLYEYWESYWTPIHRRVVNMEEEIIDRITKEQTINKFSDGEKRIIELKLQGYKMEEIAKMLKKNIHTVRSMYFYATKKPEFREILSGEQCN